MPEVLIVKSPISAQCSPCTAVVLVHAWQAGTVAHVTNWLTDASFLNSHPCLRCCSYFQAPMTGIKDNAGASAVFEGMTHSGVMYWALNVTDVVGLSGAKVVYGNASLSSEAGELSNSHFLPGTAAVTYAYLLGYQGQKCNHAWTFSNYTSSSRRPAMCAMKAACTSGTYPLTVCCYQPPFLPSGCSGELFGFGRPL